MKMVLGGIAAAIVIAVVVGLILPRVREPAYQAYSTSSARVGNPGTNLVQGEWHAEEAAK